MPPIFLVLLSLADVVLYTIRGYTNKLFAISYDGESSATTPIFSAITGFSGFLFTLLFSGKLETPTYTTLLCGISAGCILFLYDLGNIKAAKTGPYSVQSIIGMFGSVILPLLFECLLWNVRLNAIQWLGVVLILLSFVLLNLNGKDNVGIRKGFYGWITLLFISNGIYSTIVAAQQRWTANEQKSEMIAIVFLTMTVVSMLYLVCGRKAKINSFLRLKKRNWCYALISSIALSVAMRLLVILLQYVSASVLYPVLNSAVLLLLVLLSALTLREKINKYMIAGIVFALAGIIALSVQQSV